MNDGLAHSYTYDAEGNVLAVDGGQTASYVFDAQNRRVRVQNSSGTLEFLSDAMGRRTSTWNAANNFGIEGRIYMDGRQLAFRGGNGGETIFDGKDVLGTERLRTNYAGQMVTYGRSLAFGDGFDQSVYTPNADQDNSQFAGLDLDGETGTSHATFRQLSTTQGRWMSPDPYDGSYDHADPQSLNRYVYVRNNPLAMTDPFGEKQHCDIVINVSSSGSSETGTCGDDGTGNTLPWFLSEYGAPSGWDLLQQSGAGIFIADSYTYTHYDYSAQTPVATQPAPSNAPKQSAQQCATNIANRWSIAGLLPGAPGTGNSFGGGLVGGLLGNNVTNVTGIWNTIFNSGNPVSTAGNITGAGASLGMGSSVGAQGPFSAIVSQIAPKAVGEFLNAAVLPKWIIDTAIYGEALSYCKTGKY